MANTQENLENSVQLLFNNSWIYDFKLTRFFIDQPWKNSPFEWLPVLQTMTVDQMNGIPFGHYEEDWPHTLKQFIQNCLALSIPRQQNMALFHASVDTHIEHCSRSKPAVNSEKRGQRCDKSVPEVQVNELGLSVDDIHPLLASDIDTDIRKGMSGKKIHEVCHMTALIDHVIRKTGCNAVVDVGSGLGYLGQVLHSKYGHPVLGLEGKQSHTAGAERRTVQNSLCTHLQNATCELQQTKESSQELLFLINDWFQSLSNDGRVAKDSECNSSSQELLENSPAQSKYTGRVAKDSECNSSSQELLENSQAQSKYTGRVAKDSECNPSPQELLENSQAQGVDQVDYLGNMLCKCDIDKETANRNKRINSGTLPPQVCMVGLHCCGDLTPTMLKCFRELDCVRSLCFVSCCYHRMKYNAIPYGRAGLLCPQLYISKTVTAWSSKVGQLIEEESCCFENFPMSICVKDIMKRVSSLGVPWNISRFGMRLAAQETRARWKTQTSEDHNSHIRNVAYRGILEACLEQGMFNLKKTSRKLAHQEDFKDFSTYVQAVSKHILIPQTEKEEIYQQRFNDEMNKLFTDYQQYMCYIEPITALQVLLQPVIETLIYLDRKFCLYESDLGCDIIPVFDEYKSPRNLALIAVK